MKGGALRRWVAIAASVLIGLLLVVPAPAAWAGEIWVTDGAGSCNAFSVYANPASFIVPSSCPMTIQAGNVIPLGENAYWMTTAPPGITINSAWTANGDVNAGNWTTGVVIGDFWRDVNSGAWGGSTLAQGQHWFNTGLEGSSNINSQFYGMQMVCTENNWSFGGCGYVNAPWFTVSGIELEGTENTAPSVTGQGALWASGSYVWNPPGDDFAVGVLSSDVSGVCSSGASAGTQVLNGPSEPRDDSVWQQCPNPVSWSFSVDTRSQVPTDGAFQINLSAVNAAGVVATVPKTVWVDNDPVGVSFRTPNDPSPSVWVNHAVTLDATPSAGPSGVGGMNCQTDDAPARPYPASGLTIDGNGVHTVSCVAWNQATGPQGQPNTGGNSTTIRIDEAPPAIAFEPTNPSDPTAVVVDTSDNESGAAGGSIEMAPAGTNDWTSLPISFDGTHLRAGFDDAGMNGSYAFRATACDNAGNCATTTHDLALPVRAAPDSQVSLTRIVNPLQRRIVREQVRVGWHWATIRRDHKLVRVKRGGHLKTIRVVKYVEQCSTKRVHTTRNGWRLRRICRTPQVHVTKTLFVHYGRKVTLAGLYTTASGVPLSGQPVRILAAPDNNSGAFTQVAIVTTGPNGSWSATLPPGPSRIIRAVTDGTATLLPSSGQVTTIVPAKVKLLRVWPRHVPWGGTVHLVGQLIGGYLPPDGALVRLRIGSGSARVTYGIREHVSGNGRFTTSYTFGLGDPSVLQPFWFQIASLPMGNYPYAPSDSRKVTVIVGGHPSPSPPPPSGNRARPRQGRRHQRRGR
jgi:hypothetical protein